MPRVFVHVHVPKSAGQTFNWILKRYFGRGYAQTADDVPGQIYTEAEKREFLRQRPGLRCVSGHMFRYPGPALPGVAYDYLAFVRHPVERLVSLYAYERLHSPATHSSHRPIAHWIDARLAEDNALRNYQAFHLLGARDPEAVEYEAARRLLDSFLFVGITELFDQSLLLLRRKLGLSLYDLYYCKINATDSKEKFPLDEQTRRRLLELNQVDLQLYEYARGKVEGQLAQLDPGRVRADLARLEAIRRAGPARMPLHFKLRRRLRALLPAPGLAGGRQ